MIEFFIVLTIVTLLAYYLERTSVTIGRCRSGKLRRYRRREINPYGFYSILVILIFFVGLRVSYNDTWVYRLNFVQLVPGMQSFERIDWRISENPGFQICNIIIKTYISQDPQVMLFLYSFITIILLFLFYRRWSTQFWLTVFLFGSSSTLLFSMAAVKQVAAMSIGLWGISCFLKNKRYWFVVLVLIGTSLHAFLPFYLTAFFLYDKVWSKKVLLAILGALVAGLFIEQFIELTSSATQLIGAEYEKHGELAEAGMNVMRFAVYCVTPVLTWIYRHQINEKGDKLMILFSNFTLIGWCFMFVALFVSANMFGRMAAYFDPFMHLALTTLLVRYIPRTERRFVLSGCITAYCIFLFSELFIQGFVY